MSPTPKSPAATLEHLFKVAIARAHPSGVLAAHLPRPGQGQRILVLGAGKAAAAMAIAADAGYRDLGDGLISGHVTTRYGFRLPNPEGRITIGEAAHPVPDAASAAEAARALDLAAGAAGPDTHMVVLLSGGASALWSAPVAGVTLDEKRQLTRDLLKCGAAIDEINTVRRHISGIKGGKLARAGIRARSFLTLAISDVPGDKPEAIGSGPTVADPTTLTDARAVLAKYRLTPAPAIAAALADPANETLKPGDPALAKAEYRIVAAPKASLEAAGAEARRLGCRVVMLSDALEGEARDRAREHATMARALKADATAEGRPIVILSGGELTVTIRGNGTGGPNQEYALALAIALGGANGIHAIAGDTDGIDGGGGEATDPAGALVLDDTLDRARQLGLDPVHFLSNNDSTGFFRRLGRLVEIGPTQTNVNDFRAILIEP